MRLMTQNQWKNNKNLPAWEAIGENCSAEARAKGFAKVFDELSPDVVGIQEISPIMLSSLVQELAEKNIYYTVIWGADTPIVYRSEKLELVDSFFAYHSEHIDGLDGAFNNEKTKSFTVAVFREKETSRLFTFANTHLWWKSGDPDSKCYQAFSDEARAYQITQVMEKAECFSQKYNCPVVLVGDLNADYNSQVIEAAFDYGYVHAHSMATEYADNTNGTHYCFGSGFKPYYPEAFEKGIDHILIKGHGVEVKRFDRYYPEYYMPLSDHFPAFIDVEF